MRLKDKVIFLTGGADGIGWECAKAYANEGAKLVICGLDAQYAQQKANQLAGTHYGIRCDVSNDSEVKAAITFVLEAFGRLDVIHNNAGVGAPTKPIHETTMDEWDKVFNTNIKSVFLTTRHGLEALKATKGCILNTSSMAGVLGQANHAAYTATKGGMNALTKSMALDYAEIGVRVNAICPAGVWTPMLREWVSEQAEPQAMEDYLNDIHALGYCPEGDVIASSAVYLLSNDARFVTGHILHVSGGAELGYRRV
ncbi:short-chain dehydrogenase [Saccharobesus litoralis]|uniref:Short-chain dehydrogenase n=1 Tax=Saccharobesus litoralis TaxID=2172099 RepID=A0A2S0VMX8_9ALTE|nr:SDR family oxidoreductase [Saccharobesus litoralis]AWB65578.1 short-chain dehydrogenase [Saccharobesus litoralis]